MNSSWIYVSQALTRAVVHFWTVNRTTKLPRLWSWRRLSSIPSLSDRGCCWNCPAVWCWNCAFPFILYTFSFGWVILHPPRHPTSSTPSYPHTHPQPSTHPPDRILEPPQIKKLITMRKCWMSLRRDITVGVGVFFKWLILFIASPSSPCLPPLSYRDLCQSPVGHRDVLWHRPSLSLPLRLLEALLAAMAGQGGRRPEPDIGAAARKRRRRKPRGRRPGGALAPAAAEEGGHLLVLALPHPGPAGPAPPPFLWFGGAGEGGGRGCGWGAKWDPGALLPGHGLLPQQCWWEREQAHRH